MRVFAVVLIAFSLSTTGRAADVSHCGSLSSLDWLLGDWIADGSKSTFRESWTALGPKTFEGRGLETSKADDTVQSGEELRLLEMAGGVYYVSKVSHNELPVAFQLRECAGGRFVFVNPAHDFPRQLEYVRGADERLRVRVSDGAEKGFSLDFARAPVAAATLNAVLAAEDARFEAMIRANPEAMRHWFADDLLYVHSTGEVVERDQLIASITSGRVRYIAVEPAERQVIFSGPESAFVQGRARIQVAAGPNQLDFQARYLAIYGLSDGAWRLRAWQSLRLP